MSVYYRGIILCEIFVILCLTNNLYSLQLYVCFDIFCLMIIYDFGLIFRKEGKKGVFANETVTYDGNGVINAVDTGNYFKS
jgi:hypothetical protein